MTVQAPVPGRIIALQIAICAAWGIGQVAAKLGNAGISPLFHSGLRSLGAVVLLICWMALRGIRFEWRRDILGLSIAIGILFGMEMILLFVGLRYTDAARATLMLYTAPFFVALEAHLWIPGERLTSRGMLGLVAAFGGVGIAFHDRLSLPDPHALMGDLLCLAGAVCWAATTLMIKASRLRALSPEQNLLSQLATSALLSFAASALAGEAGIFAPSPTIWLALAYQIVIVVTIGYLLWFWLIAKYRATTLSTLTFLTPVFGVLAAWIMLSEPISLSLLLAVAAIAAGIVLVNRG